MAEIQPKFDVMLKRKKEKARFWPETDSAQNFRTTPL